MSALASLVAARRAVVQFAREHRHAELSPAGIGLAQCADGKPELRGDNLPDGLDITLADGAGVSVALVGPPPVGVDLETVACRDCETWRGLLGMDGYALALRVQRETGEPFDCAATRVWTLLEAGKKAFSLRRILPQFAGSLGGAWLSFKADDAGQTREFISVLLSQAEEVIGLSAVVSNDWKLPVAEVPKIGNEVAAASAEKSKELHLPAKFRFEKYGFCFRADYSGPQKQLLFAYRFPVLFRDCQTASRKLEFARYASWMGDLREYASSGVFPELADLISSGKWGMATNNYRVEILGELSPGDIVEGRLWQEYANNEVWVLKSDWQAISRDGKVARVALTEMGFSVVKIVGHGIAKIESMPEQLREFFNDMLPKTDSPPKPLEELPSRYQQFKLGAVVWQQATALHAERPLFRHDLATTTENSNWVGNIYFANYGEWMGHVRDLYFHRLTPKSFKHYGKDGEWVCLECAIEHLSEAMPYDVIRVEMRLVSIHRCGLELAFDYYLLENGQPVRKLAHGQHKMAWVSRDACNEPVLLEVPRNVVETLMREVARVS